MKDRICKELEKAGMNPVEEEMMERLKELRITPDGELEKKRFLFRLHGRPCFPRGELVAITGKKKSGKSFFCSMLMVLSYRPQYMSMTRIENEDMTVLWVDTEQSEESTQEMLKSRILRACEYSEMCLHLLHAFNLRSVNWRHRMSLIGTAIVRLRPDLVIFDGIRDVVNDINDGAMAQEVVESLMQLASQTNCCVVCVLHQNKAPEDKTLRGALGTELGNKCFEEYECRKDDNRVFYCQQTSTRKYDIPTPLMFTVDSEGMPRLWSTETERQASLEGEAMSMTKLNMEYMRNGELDYRKAFDKLLPTGTTMRAHELKQRFMRLTGLGKESVYNWLRIKAMKEGVVCRIEHNPQWVEYVRGSTLSPVTPLPC